MALAVLIVWFFDSVHMTPLLLLLLEQLAPTKPKKKKSKDDKPFAGSIFGGGF